MSNDIDKHMNALERRANVVRSRLLRTVDALDVRRHQVEQVGVKAKEVAPKVGLAVLGLAAVSTAAVFGLVRLVRGRRREDFKSRLANALGGFKVKKEPPFAIQVLQRITLTAATMLVTEATRRGLKNFTDGRLPDGRLAVGRALDIHHEAMKG